MALRGTYIARYFTLDGTLESRYFTTDRAAHKWARKAENDGKILSLLEIEESTP